MNLTHEETERLALLSEECGEVVQVIGKILRHGYNSTHPNGGPNNRQLLEREVGDIIYAVGLLTSKKDLDENELVTRAKVKSQTVKTYLHYQ